MAFAIDAGQRMVRERVGFSVARLPVFDPRLGTSVRDPALDARLEELTIYFTVFSFIVPRPEVIVAASIDEALASGTRDFCLIQNAGHIFYGHGGLAVDFLDALEACEFLTGGLREGGGYFYLGEQCLLVNRRTWEKLGRPAFGLPHEGSEQLAIPDYRTPAQAGLEADLLPSSRTPLPLRARFGHGWNAISASLAAGIPVRQWRPVLNRWRIECGAYMSDLGGWQKALLDSIVTPRPDAPAPLRDYLQALASRLVPAPGDRPVFVFNSEADVDIPTAGIRPGIDTAFVLASGFKSNRILESFGFHDATSVVFYDYSAPALALKRLAVEEWDGADFGAFFMGVRPRLEAMFGGKLTYMQAEAFKTEGTINHEFQAEMRTVFGSFEHWIAHWRRFTRLAHRYVEIDLIAEPDAATGMIAEHARGACVMWISDMFNAPYAVGRFSWPRRRAAFSAFTAALAKHGDSYFLLGGAPSFWGTASR